MGCPVKNKEYLDLENSLGEGNALAAWHLNGEKTPTLDQANKLLDSKKLNVIHHGETLEDIQDKNSGDNPIGLAPKGIKETTETAKTEDAKQLRTIYSSPTVRAQETAEILKKYNGANVVTVEGLKPWNLGKFQSRPTKEFPEKFYVKNPDIQVPSGESFNEFYNRFTNAVQSLRNIATDEAILTHSKGINILRALESNYGDFKPEDYFKHALNADSQDQFLNIKQFNQGSDNDLKIDQKRDTNTIYHQLTSDQIQNVDKDLNNTIIKFLEPFGIKIQDIDDFKQRFGLDSFGVADVLNKIIYLNKNNPAKLDTIPHEAAHIITMLMGENHFVLNELMKNIHLWSGYENIKDQYGDLYSDEQHVRKEAVDQLIAKCIVDKWQIKKDEKNASLLQRIINKIKEFFDSFTNRNSLEAKAGSIAESILKGDRSIIDNKNIEDLKPNDIEEDPSQYLYHQVFTDVFQNKGRFKYKNTVPITPEDSINKILKEQKNLHLDDSIIDDPKDKLFGQRRHTYSEDVNGEKKHFASSVTSTIDKPFRAKENPELVQKNLDIAQAGTDIHKDIENLLRSYLNPDGTIRKNGQIEPLERISPEETYYKLANFVHEIIEHYKNEDVIIIPEAKIADRDYFDEKKKNDFSKGFGLAGTIDLLVIYKDGSYDKYDWKSIASLSKEGLDEGRKKSFTEQSNKLADILAKTYGLKDRRVDLMVPLKLEGEHVDDENGVARFIPKDIKISSFNFENLEDEDAYLRPHIVHFYQSDNEQIQQTLDKLNNLYKQQVRNFNKMSNSEKTAIEIRAKKIQNAAYKIAFRKDLSGLTDYIYSELQNAAASIEKLNKGDKDINLSRLIERMRAIQTFEKDSLNKQYLEQLKDSSYTAEELNIIKNRKSTLDEYVGRAARAEKYLIEAAIKETQKLSNLANLGNITTPEQQLDFTQRWATTQSQTQMRTTQLFTRLYFQAIETSRANQEKESQPFIQNAKEIKEKYTNPIKVFKEKLLRKDYKGNYLLINNFTKEFFKAKKEMASMPTDIMKSWYENNTVFDRTRYENDLNKKQTSLKEMVDSNQITKDEMDQELELFVNKYDVGKNFENPEAIRNGAYGNKYLIGNEKWYSEEYKEILKTPELLSLYNNMIAFNKSLAQEGLIEDHQIYTFFPSVSTKMMEAKMQGENINAVDRVWEKLSNSNQELNNKKDVNPLTNEEWRELKMPFLHASDDASSQNVDITKVYTQTIESFEKYKALKNIENNVEKIIITEENKNVLVPSKGDAPSQEAFNKTNAALLKELVDLQMYGKVQDFDNSIDIAPQINKVISKIPIVNKLVHLDENRKLSTQKLINSAIQYNTVVGLAFRIKSILSNIVGGEGNISFQGKSGLYFNDRMIKNTYMKLATNDSKMKAAIKYFDFRMESHLGKELSKEAQTTKKIPNPTDILLIGHRKGDELVENHVGGSILQMYKLDDSGNIVNIRQEILHKLSAENKTISDKDLLEAVTEESKKSSLYATMKLDKDNNPYWEDSKGNKIDLDKIPTDKDGNPTAIESPYTQMRRTALQVTYKVLGNMNPEDRSGMHTLSVMKAFTSFRNWIPGQVESRTGKWKYESATDTYSVGRWREFFNNFFSGEGIGGFMKHQLLLSSLLGSEITNPGIREAAYRRYDQIKADFAKRGQDFHMSKEEYFHQSVGIIKSMMRETMITAGTLSLMLLSASIAKQVQDKNERARLNFAHKSFAKFYNEFSFYYDPREFEQLFNNTIPAIGLLKNFRNLMTNEFQEIYGSVTGNKSMLKSAHPTREAIKFIPGASSMAEIISLFDEDFRKYMGYSGNVAGYF